MHADTYRPPPGWASSAPAGPVQHASSLPIVYVPAEGAARLPDPPGAVPVFVFGLLALISWLPLGAIFWPLGLVAWPLGAIAWLWGGCERSAVRAGRYRCSGLLTAGYVMGLISTLMLLIPLLLFAGFLLLVIVCAAAAAVAVV